MRFFGQNAKWEARLLAGLVGAAVLGGATQAWSVQSIILTNSNPAAKAKATYLYSPGVADVLKMVEAKVDPEVIKAYIKNSAVPYNPSAVEVIALQNKGVPPEILTALLQRGAELRAQVAQGPTAAQGQGQYPGYPGTATQPASMPPYPYDYGMDYGPYPMDYGYGGYPYGYGGYPYGGWWYTSFWPWWWGNGFGFDSFNHHRHGFGPRFQNDDFNRFRSARFQNDDFNRGIGAFAPAQFNNRGFAGARFNNGAFAVARFNNRAFAVPRTGLTPLGVPSRAFAPGAFARGVAPAAFIGASGGTAGTIRPPGGTFAGRTAFAARTGGFAFHGGGMRGGGGGHGGGGGGHR